VRAVFGLPLPVLRLRNAARILNRKRPGTVLMSFVLSALIMAGLLPLSLALWANRGTSLLHALIWALVAWLSFGLAFLCDDLERAGMQPGRYCAVCLTGCAGVAVLGARRPHVFAWSFVVLGLFAVMVLPLMETQFIGTHPVDGLRILFMAGTIAVGILNYLPTRLAPAALLLMLIGAGEITLLYAPTPWPGFGAGMVFDLLLSTVPWLTWICLARRAADRSDFDRLWLNFRDRWGLVWSQRVREQFDRAAQHAGWPVKLAWHGLTQEKDEAPAADQVKFVEMLQKTLQRFLAAN
jgi:hypothetical protein